MSALQENFKRQKSIFRFMSGNKAYGHFKRLGVTHFLVNVILLLFVAQNLFLYFSSFRLFAWRSID